jgi:MGT family glycosyltransferase
MMSEGPQGFAPTPDSMARFHAAAHLLASTFGLPAMEVRDIFGYASDLNIVFLPREFQPFGETFDDRFVFAGPSLGPRSAHSGFSVPATESGEKLLFISLGTVFNQWPEFFEMCFEAFARQPVKVIASVGQQMDIKSFKRVPDNFFLYPQVPQLEVLQKADVFITHAGMNGTMEAVCAGVPLIAIPQMIEQAATAKRIQELGIGIALTRETTTAATLREGFQKIIHDKSYRQ